MDPSPTNTLQVSAMKTTMAKKTRNDATLRNQNIEGQLHRMSNNPLINGAMLGGVFKLVLTSAAGRP